MGGDKEVEVYLGSPLNFLGQKKQLIAFVVILLSIEPQIRRFGSYSPILLVGEPGSGKTAFATRLGEI